MAQDSRLTTSDQMQDLLLDSPEFPDFLLGLATMSASLVRPDGQVTCTITVERDGGPATFASSSEAGRRLAETQYAFHDGPCLTAVREQRLVLIPDLRGDARWSDYLEAALQEGVRSILAVPIPTEPFSRAGLNCYASTVGAFPGETVALLEQHAASMSRVLRIALRLHSANVQPEHLRAAKVPSNGTGPLKSGAAQLNASGTQTFRWSNCGRITTGSVAGLTRCPWMRTSTKHSTFRLHKRLLLPPR